MAEQQRSQYAHLTKTEREEVIEIAKEYTDNKMSGTFVGCRPCGVPVIDRREFLEAHCQKFHSAKFEECRHMFINLE